MSATQIGRSTSTLRIARRPFSIRRGPSARQSARTIASSRGLPNRPFRFYFDRVVDANFPLDIFGFLTARLESGATAVTIETRCRWGHANSPGFYGPQQFVESAVVVKPEEIVEVRLPKLDAGAGPFARREFSIRIRARQLR